MLSEYEFTSGEVLFCANCEEQKSQKRVNEDFSCKICNAQTVSWYNYDTVESATKKWEKINGKLSDFRERKDLYIETSSSLKTSIKSNINMAQEIERQIELLKQAQAEMNTHVDELTTIIDYYTQLYIELEQNGLNHDYLSFIEEYRLNVSGKLLALSDEIEADYQPLLGEKIRYLEDRI